MSSSSAKPGIRGAFAPQRRWKSRGLSPTISRNLALNDPRLLNPTDVHTSVTVRLVARSRSWARSIRRWETYAAGVTPYVAVKSRWKWYLLMPAVRASAARSSGSA
jgi:hypothetical protein